jgi:hypothetical protein
MAFGLSAATIGLIGAGASVASGLMGANAASSAADAQAEGAAQANATQRYMYDQTRRDNASFLNNGTAANNELARLLGIGGGASAMSAAPNTYAPGQSGNPLWEKVLGDFNTEHAAAYGMGMNRDWNADPQAMQTKATLDERYRAAQANDPAYQAQMAQQQQGSDYGSLMRNFSQSDMNADPVYNSGLQFGLDEGRKGLERQSSASGSNLSGATLKALTRFGNDYGSTKANESYNRFQTNQGNQFNRLSALSGTGQTAVGQVGAAGQNMASNISQNQIGMGNARAASSIGQSNAITGAIGQGFNMYQGQQYMDILRKRQTPYASAPTTGNYLGAWDGD